MEIVSRYRFYGCNYLFTYLVSNRAKYINLTMKKRKHQILVRLVRKLWRLNIVFIYIIIHLLTDLICNRAKYINLTMKKGKKTSHIGQISKEIVASRYRFHS